MVTETQTCTNCNGRGVNRALVMRRPGGCVWQDVTCSTCGGAGWLSNDHIARIEAGRRMREERIAAGISQSERAAELGISMRELSDREHGR